MTPAIAQLAEHLTETHAVIRWSLVRFRVAGFQKRNHRGARTRDRKVKASHTTDWARGLMAKGDPNTLHAYSGNHGPGGNVGSTPAAGSCM